MELLARGLVADAHEMSSGVGGEQGRTALACRTADKTGGAPQAVLALAAVAHHVRGVCSSVGGRRSGGARRERP